MKVVTELGPYNVCYDGVSVAWIVRDGQVIAKCDTFDGPKNLEWAERIAACLYLE
jgi:hypothetical protein